MLHLNLKYITCRELETLLWTVSWNLLDWQPLCIVRLLLNYILSRGRITLWFELWFPDDLARSSGLFQLYVGGLCAKERKKIVILDKVLQSCSEVLVQNLMPYIQIYPQLCPLK